MRYPILYCIFPGLVAFLPINPEKGVRTWPHPEFSLSSNQFAFNLLNAVLDQDPAPGNKLVAPLSVYFSLGMLYNGAGHATRDSIGGALQTGDIALPNLNSMCKEALQQMPLADNSVKLTIASSLWFNRKKMTLSPIYESLMSNFFYSQPQPLNFGAPNAAAVINQWVDQNTGHKITSAIDHTRPADGMYLIDAFYFKGNWLQPFTPDPIKEDFYLRPDSTPVKVSYMHRTDVIPTFSDTGFTMIELPCGTGKNYSIFALLPEDENRSAAGLARTMTPARLNDALSKLTPQKISLSLPSWEYTYSIDDLHPALSRLGMGLAFSPNGEADFSGMFSSGAKRAYLSRAKHTATIRVNENGMEAAAVPVESVNPMPGLERHRHKEPRVIRFDHPFLYVLADKQRNLLLLTGIVNDPTLKASQPVTSPKPPAARHRLLRKK